MLEYVLVGLYRMIKCMAAEKAPFGCKRALLAVDDPLFLRIDVEWLDGLFVLGNTDVRAKE